MTEFKCLRQTPDMHGPCGMCEGCFRPAQSFTPQWKPIKDPPPHNEGRDSIELLGWIPEWEVVRLIQYNPYYLWRNDEYKYLWTVEDCHWEVQPSHWMPLPEGPDKVKYREAGFCRDCGADIPPRMGEGTCKGGCVPYVVEVKP